MERITYVLSIPPISIPFVKMIKSDLSLKAWLHSYENKESDGSAKKCWKHIKTK